MKIGKMLRWAVANAAERIEGVIGCANDFSLVQGDWIQITPLGNFPHARGLQRVDKVAIEKMANAFNSTLAKLARRFGGVPFYVGHPDVRGLGNEYTDKKAYGWINALESREDGLYGQVKWNAAGTELVANAHYKFFSPYWDAEEIGQEGGKRVFRPVKLMSVGLTNEPNIPVLPLTNEKENQMDKAVLIALLQLANTATEEEVTNRIKELQTAAGKVTGLVNEKTTVSTSLENEKTAHSGTKTALENERKARITVMLDNAQLKGQITPAERAGWQSKLETNFDGEAAALAGLAPKMKTAAASAGAGSRNTAMANDVQERAVKVQGLVNSKMREGLSYDDAWAAVKAEHAGLFDQMARK